VADKRGYFGPLADWAANSQGGLSLGGIKIKSPLQILGSWFGGQNSQEFADTHGVGLRPDSQQRLESQIWGQPLMSSAGGSEEDGQQYAGQVHESTMRPSGHSITPISGGGGGYHSSSSNYLGATTNLAGNGRGQTVGHATMSDVENMISGGIGRDSRAAMMTQGREMDERRKEAKRNGMTLKEYRQSGQ
jgi:hypothetical protein